jgi:hypothetical protein
MKDYKFKLVREIDLVIPAMTEDEAWVEIAKIDPNLIADGWQIHLLNTNSQLASAGNPAVPEPFDDVMNSIDAFDDLSYLNPRGI